MIIPLGHEKTTVRRQPWVSFSIIGLCVVVFLLTNVLGGSVEEQLSDHSREAVEYFFQHPYLELDPRLQDALFQGTPDSQEEAYKEVFKEMGAKPPDSQVLLDQYQAELDRLTAKLYETMYDLPWYRWGLVPADKTLHGFITYQFMHGGWLHLIGNMFFLFLAGPFIEDVWGRPVFASFYLTAGALSALLYALHYPDLNGPLIGASASVAGLMGAFLIRYWNIKIKFFYWFFFFFYGTFAAPAWLMLPLWALRELFSAQAMDVVGATGGGGVAHWAHVFGFVFGVLVAVGIKHFKVEERFLSSAIEEKITLFDNSALDEALDTYRDGKHNEALAMLRKISIEQPENIDASIAYWNMAVEMNQPAAAAPLLLRVVKRAIRKNEIEFVDPQFLELAREVPEQPYDPATAVRLGEFLRRADRVGDVEEILEAAERSLTTATPVAVLIKLTRLAEGLRSRSTAVFVARALEHAELPEEQREGLELIAERFPLQAPPEAEYEDSESEDYEEESEYEEDSEEEEEEEEAEPRTLKVMEAVPAELSGSALTLDIAGKTHKLSLDQVEAVAVAGVAPEGERSFILVDILLDSPAGFKTNLRTVRVKSTRFDPRKLVGETQVMPAFRKFLRAVLEASEATCMPEAGVADGGALARFASVEEYEREVLGVGW